MAERALAREAEDAEEDDEEEEEEEAPLVADVATLLPPPTPPPPPPPPLGALPLRRAAIASKSSRKSPPGAMARGANCAECLEELSWQQLEKRRRRRRLPPAAAAAAAFDVATVDADDNAGVGHLFFRIYICDFGKLCSILIKYLLLVMKKVKNKRGKRESAR